MSEWKKVKLGDCCEITSSKRCHASERSKEGIPFYCSKEIILLENGEEVRDSDFIPVELYESIKHKYDVPKPGDLLLTTRGTNGIPYIYKDKDCFYFADGNLSWFKNFQKELSVRYLYYWFKSHIGKHSVDSIAKGTAQKAVPIDGLRNLDIELPPFTIQHRIATILSRYDSLIENYQKQIKLLEEAAQRLYKEWFVDLHFPGHENTKIVDGVPEGWEKKKIADVCDTIGGGTPSTKVSSYYEGGTISWVTPTDITKNNSLCLLSTEKKITHEGLNHSSAKMLPKEAILMTSRASVGFFGICDFEVCTNQGFISCVPFENDFQMYLLYNLINRVEEIKIKAGGSTYLEISKSVFRNFDIICPTQSVIKEFQGKAHCLLERTRIIAKQIRLLTEARDRLLPKLMSGEIAV